MISDGQAAVKRPPGQGHQGRRPEAPYLAVAGPAVAVKERVTAECHLPHCTEKWGHFNIVDVKNGQCVRVLGPYRGGLFGPTWSPSGKSLAVTREREVAVIDVK